MRSLNKSGQIVQDTYIYQRILYRCTAREGIAKARPNNNFMHEIMTMQSNMYTDDGDDKHVFLTL